MFKTIFYIAFITILIYASTQKRFFQQSQENPFTLTSVDDTHNQLIFDSFKRIEAKRVKQEQEQEEEQKEARKKKAEVEKKLLQEKAKLEAEKRHFITEQKRLAFEKEEKRLALLKKEQIRIDEEKKIRNLVAKKIIALKEIESKKYALLEKKKKEVFRKEPSFHSITAHIDLSEQKLSVYKGTALLYEWKVSTARRGYITPIGTYSPLYMQKMHYSKKYHNSPMPYSIFFKGGYAIHGTRSISRLGHIASHGCVRLHPRDAKSLYALVKQYGKENTTITIAP